LNVIWIVSDTFRWDHLGAYGLMPQIRTPVLDALAAGGTRFNRHYAGSFPTMPARADHATGRWTMSFLSWEPLPPGLPTLSQLLSAEGIHTAAVADTPFYLRNEMNYDRGFQSFFPILGQEGGITRMREAGHHESMDMLAWWRKEADRNVARTMTQAGEWLEQHYKEQFFLYVDTWDPHEPWDAPPYYTELYLPGYDGSIVQPPYAYWQEAPGYTKEMLTIGHASYMGEITMVDTWIGYLLAKVRNMGLDETTAIIFTTDHGFYFGEHGGIFGKMLTGKDENGKLYERGVPGAQWGHSPLYEETAHIPLLIRVPGVPPGTYDGLTSVVDIMPTVLDIFGKPIPAHVEGRSLIPAMRDASTPGRELTVTTLPFANTGQFVWAVDNVSRKLGAPPVTTVTAGDLALLYSPAEGASELYDLKADPRQLDNLIHRNTDAARGLHELLVKFMRDGGVSADVLETRLDLRL
jgi:arylsulfatase A-like enzyme